MVPEVPIQVPCGELTSAMTPGKPAVARVSSRTCWKDATVASSNPAPPALDVVTEAVDVVVTGDFDDVVAERRVAGTCEEVVTATSGVVDPQPAPSVRTGTTARRGRPLAASTAVGGCVVAVQMWAWLSSFGDRDAVG